MIDPTTLSESTRQLWPFLKTDSARELVAEMDRAGIYLILDRISRTRIDAYVTPPGTTLMPQLERRVREHLAELTTAAELRREAEDRRIMK